MKNLREPNIHQRLRAWSIGDPFHAAQPVNAPRRSVRRGRGEGI